MLQALDASAAAASGTPERALWDACRLDLRRVPPGRRMEVWRAIVGAHYDVALDSAASPGFGISLQTYRLDTLITARLSGSPRVARRGLTPRRSGTGNFIKLRVNEAGACDVHFEHDRHRLGPGAVHILDHACGRIERHDRHRTLSVWIPHAALDWRTGERPALLSLPFGAAGGLMLRDAMQGLYAAAPIATGREPAALAAGFSGLARGILDGAALTEQEPEIRAARIRSMRRFLDERLQDPDLGPEALLQAFGAARATIYRDFAEAGGVARYIRTRRLERAFDELAAAAPERGLVRRVAERWCFSSVAHFSEAFRETHGCTPGSVIGLRAASAAASAADPRAFAWIGDAGLEREVATLRGFYQMMSDC